MQRPAATMGISDHSAYQVGKEPRRHRPGVKGRRPIFDSKGEPALPLIMLHRGRGLPAEALCCAAYRGEGTFGLGLLRPNLSRRAAGIRGVGLRLRQEPVNGQSITHLVLCRRQNGVIAAIMPGRRGLDVEDCNSALGESGISRYDRQASGFTQCRSAPEPVPHLYAPQNHDPS